MTALLHFDPPVIGHRGASAYAPENTIASFTKAMLMGVKWVEFDVTLSSDGEPIIFHDERLDRTTNGHGEVSDFPYSYLRSLDAGAWFHSRFSGERIPTLRAVIEFLQNGNMSANIELKPVPGREEQLIRRVMKDMEPYLSSANHKYLFSSFSMETLHLLRQYAPGCQLGMLLHEWESGWQGICNKLQCVSVHVNHEIVVEADIREIRNMGKAALCYTVNDSGRAKRLFAYGVNAVFSDVPDKILKTLCLLNTKPNLTKA
ncbi:Glycerophosphoryl diester phosphodiesterase [Aquicella siphonis]|uniref:Glycerophosphoryl diester phosphodiesterase n=1 Tax=Aquicella siphonis TaxID=254247 RepID=A0A5E4PHL4_9COXI|nr:glycerophosphoryl diester phosphodiesterase [Aquicella siphonis]VVC76085.1 Glycerophosphoryl diester phosphodiesterase [Aquicella siphonis]